MITVMDDAHSIFYGSLEHRETLSIFVWEGFRDEKPQDIELGDVVLEGSYGVGVSPSSRRFKISFENPIAWEVIDESYTSFEENETGDREGFLRKLEKSHYLEYITRNHGWFSGQATHFRLLTEDYIVEVISQIEPTIETFA